MRSALLLRLVVVTSSGCGGSSAFRRERRSARMTASPSYRFGSKRMLAPVAAVDGGAPCLEVRREPGRVFVRCGRCARLVVPRVGVAPVIQFLGEGRELERMKCVA